jgi:hypothetical protein
LDVADDLQRWRRELLWGFDLAKSVDAHCGSTDVSSIDSGLLGKRTSGDLTYRFYEYKSPIFIACEILLTGSKMPTYTITATPLQTFAKWRLPHGERECEMTELSRLESQYDAFLFASLSETDEITLSVLSVLARQDVDPWQEAARLTQLSREQAINSLASKIWKSNSERWSPSEASILAIRLIELLPSHSLPLSNSLWTDKGNGRLTFWLVAGMLFMSIAISGNSMQKLTNSSSTPTHSTRVVVQEGAVTQSSHGMRTD